MKRVRNGLNDQARAVIKDWNQWWSTPPERVTIAGYIRFTWGRDATVWFGDACGCSDTRCKDGFHHEPWEECGCLPVLLEEYADVLAGRRPDPFLR